MNDDMKFWNLRPHVIEKKDRFTGLCVGYEASVWREDDLVDYILDWLPEFALRREECENLPAFQIRKAVRKSAQLLYNTELFGNRGEFGEIILHAAIRSVFNSFPIISKVYYKSAINDTVKGFDCVHLVEGDGGYELWLGEAKFYTKFSEAVDDVLAELESHTKFQYLKNEFILISGKIDNKSKEEDYVYKLLNSNDSMDDKIKKIRIPILLTYNSAIIKNHTSTSEIYCKRFEKHIKGQYDKFFKKLLIKFPNLVNINLKLHLFFLPLLNKFNLTQELDRKLKEMQ